MSFSDIKDQDIPVRLLRNALAQDRVPSGLLLWGPPGVGKHMTALEMAKAVNCRGEGERPCDTCLSCRKVMSGNHPDVRSFEPVKRARIIPVDTIEVMNDLAALRPHEGPWRVFILREAERMSQAAQNHFLKTLEEPPGRSLFMLLSAYPGMLLPTIRSRCQMLRFGALRPDTVAGILLRREGADQERVTAIARLSQGQVGRALDLLDSEKREVVLKVVTDLNAGEDPLGVAEEFAKHLGDLKEGFTARVKAEYKDVDTRGFTKEERDQFKDEQAARVALLFSHDILEYLYLLKMWYRDLLVADATGEMWRVVNQDEVERLQKSDARGAGAKLEAIDKAQRYLERFLKEDRVFRDLFFSLAATPEKGVV